MTSWTVTTTTTTSALPFVNGDDFTINSPGHLTANQNNKAGADCTVNDGGEFHVSAGIDFLFNNGGSYSLVINEGGRVYCDGTSGNAAVIGGDSGTDADSIDIISGGTLICNYTTIQYCSGSPSVDVDHASHIRMSNGTISHLGTYSFYIEGTSIFEEITWGDSDSDYCFRHYYGDLTIRDCTMKAGSGWIQGFYQHTIYLLGTNTIDIGGGAVEPTNANAGGACVFDFRYYPDLTLSEGNNLADCDVFVSHPSQPEAGIYLTNSANNMVYEPYIVFEKTDSSGDVDIYLLQKTYYDDTWKYWSDSGQSETGDNQKFTIGLVKDSYDRNTTTKWADDGTASITLSAAGGGGGVKLAGDSGGMVA